MNDALHNKVVKWFYDHEELLIAIMNKTPYQSDGWDYEIEVVKEFLTQPEQEPVAWMHVMDNTEGLKANGTGVVSITQKRKHPFGKAGIDFSKSYPVTSTPLFATPPQRTEPVIDKSAAIRIATTLGWTPPRTWVELTDEEYVEACQMAERGNYLVAFQRIQAKLRSKNG